MVWSGDVWCGRVFNNNLIGRKKMEPEYIPMEEARPMWGQVVTKVVERFESDSYGLIMTHEELKHLMDIQPAKTIEESKKEQLDYMSGLGKAKDVLLDDYNLCLFSVIGIGYQVLHPNEQIVKGADYYLKKSQCAMSQSMKVLANVDSEMLDSEGSQLRISKINRAAFIKAAFRKRMTPRIPKAEQKKIG